MGEAFFDELETIEVNNPLYMKWIEYAKQLTKDDLLFLIKNGMTHQANALKSMLKEATAGSLQDTTLLKKLDLITSETAKKANDVRLEHSAGL
jgi:hypothetical protein